MKHTDISLLTSGFYNQHKEVNEFCVIIYPSTGTILTILFISCGATLQCI